MAIRNFPRFFGIQFLVVILYRIQLANFMGSSKNIFVFVLLLCFSLAGCFSDGENEPEIELIVNVESNNGTIVESFSEGEQISVNIVSIEFDFSETTSDNEIVTFGIDTMDGSSPVTVNASSDSFVVVEFFNHGIYNVSAYAIDEDNMQQNITIEIKINLRIDWIESNTNEPAILTFDPRPANGGQHAVLIEVNSIVENPDKVEDIATGSQSVEITWNIIDEQNDVCQRQTTLIENGESDSWYTIHFNTYQIHELAITYEDGQDDININHSVSIVYDE